MGEVTLEPWTEDYGLSKDKNEEDKSEMNKIGESNARSREQAENKQRTSREQGLRDTQEGDEGADEEVKHRYNASSVIFSNYAVVLASPNYTRRRHAHPFSLVRLEHLA
jgi:hypothetical protein